MNCDDYRISPADAADLSGVSLMPQEIRLLLIQKHAERHGAAATLELFSQFVGMANSVVDNCRIAAETILIREGGLSPADARKANMPTLFGALQGIKLAAGANPSHLCGDCAFRVGSIPNQSSVTTCIAEQELRDPQGDFMCHHGLAPDGEPALRCLGFEAKAS